MVKSWLFIFIIVTFALSLFAFNIPETKAYSISQTYASLVQDGYTYKYGGNYLSIWGSTTSLLVTDTSNSIFGGQRYASGNYEIYRAFLFFDTSNIPSYSTIINATLSLYIQNASPGTFNATIQNGQPTYPHSPIRTSDYYQAYYSGNGGSRNVTTTSPNTYWNISLSASGLTWIRPANTTKLALRSSRDISQTAPTTTEYLIFSSFEKGSSQAPKLYISYSGDNEYIVRGPYHEDGSVAPVYIQVNIVQPYDSPDIFYLNGSDGLADTSLLVYADRPTYLWWNVSVTANYTRVYFLQDTSFDEIWIFVPDDTKPFYPYTFIVTDFFGMTQPYLETTITLGGQTRIVERKDLNTIGTVSFVMQQWSRYNLRFRCLEGLYSQSFTAEVTYSTNIQVLQGAFPLQLYGTEVFAYSSRLNQTNIRVIYADPRLETTWLSVQISHLYQGEYFEDYNTNLTATNSLTYDWNNAENGEDYYVNIQAMTNQLYSWLFINTAPSTTGTNPFEGLNSLGTLPNGASLAVIPAAIVILMVLGVFSYKSSGVGCGLSWIITGLMVALKLYTIAAPTFVFAGLVTVLIVIQESKTTEREL